MIRYALFCRDCDAEFEAWFASSDAYESQAEERLVTCPHCEGTQVDKQIMAPALSGTKSKSEPDPQRVFGKLAAAARQHVADNFDYVGDGFASEAKAMHYGETDSRAIWGETTPDERNELKQEGVAAEPLPEAFTPD
ncbi:MAG: DUF1178 family protein, partial [Henriciella sp.]|nr:DUF1178 family protein [Henriciella sp.]